MPEEKTEKPKEEEKTQEEKPELEEKPEREEAEEIETRNIGNLFSPEGAIFLPLAILIDAIGIILVLFALDDFFILDIFGILIFCPWMFFRSRTIVVPAKVKKRIEKGLAKLFRGPWKKFLVPIIGELIPYVGALPCWTLAVYYELTS